MHIEQDKYNKNIEFLLAFLLSIPLLTNFFGSISHSILGTTMYSTYIMYSLFMACFILKYRLNGKQFYFFLIITSLLLGLALLNKAVFARSSLYMYANREVLYRSMFLYYPVAYAMIYVDDWSQFFHYMRYTAFWTPFLCWIAMTYFNLGSIIGYMHLSNSLLPGFLAAWYIARIKKKRIYYISAAFSMYMQMFYGGRMSFASALIFIVLLEIIQLHNDSSRKSIIKVTVLIIATILGLTFFQEILEIFLNFLESLGIADSRTIRKIIDGSVFESKSRDLIYQRAWHEIKNMGAGMYGLFGDRIAFEKYGGIVYVHNIFYELILSFGWIIGCAVGAWLVVNIIKGFFSKKDHIRRPMVAYFVCLIFLRLLVSGSFLIEGQFLLLLGILLNRTTFETE